MITTVTLLGPGLPWSPAGSYPYLISMYRDEHSDGESVGGYLGDTHMGNLKLEYLLDKKNDRQRRGWLSYHRWYRYAVAESQVPDRVMMGAYMRELAGWRLIIRGNLKSTKTVSELQAWGDIPQLGNIEQAQEISLDRAKRLLAGRVLPPARQIDIRPASELRPMRLIPQAG